MTTARLRLDTSSAGLTAAGLVFAQLTVQIGDFVFPAPHWSDSAVVVLAWWCEAARKLVLRQSIRAEMQFMEGPFLIAITPKSAEIWKIECFERGKHNTVCAHEGEINAKVFLESLLDASMRMLALCKSQNWWTKDADKLETQQGALRQSVSER